MVRVRSGREFKRIILIFLPDHLSLYRLAVVPLRMPPLRERTGDVLLLADYFLEKYANQFNKEVPQLSSYAKEVLMDYDFPGNVRELENIIEYGFVLCPEGEIMVNQLPARLFGKTSSARRKKQFTQQVDASEERKRLMEALTAAGGNKSKAARILGISRVTLWKRLKDHDIQVDKKISG